MVHGINKKIILTQANNNSQKITNIINYSQDGTSHVLFMCNGETSSTNTDIFEYKNIDELSSVSSILFNLEMKDFTDGVPAQRKKIYGLYITYKGSFR